MTSIMNHQQGTIWIVIFMIIIGNKGQERSDYIGLRMTKGDFILLAGKTEDIVHELHQVVRAFTSSLLQYALKNACLPYFASSVDADNALIKSARTVSAMAL